MLLYSGYSGAIALPCSRILTIRYFPLSTIENTHYARVLMNYDSLAEGEFLPLFFVGILIKDKKKDYSCHLSLDEK